MKDLCSGSISFAAVALFSFSALAGCAVSEEGGDELDSAGTSSVEGSLDVKPSDEVGPLACTWAYPVASGFYPPEFLYITPTFTTSGACGHIWVMKYTGGCVQARLRYFPSSGGSFTSNYATVCQNSWSQITNNVLANTRFWVETPTARSEFKLDY